MFPTAPLPSTRITAEDFPQPVRAPTQILDVLSEFAPGQKLIAQIQFQLANGAYRATIAQRDVTLALPFSAKPGDALELEVVETEGRIAFAVSKPRADAELDTAPPASASTTLSRTGQLIGRLLQDGDTQEQKPAPLNAGEPVLKAAPTTSKDVAPALQQAITRSGLFYESHQAAWSSGNFSETALRQEPQGRLSQGNLQNFTANATLPVSVTVSSPDGPRNAVGLASQNPNISSTDTPEAKFAAEANAPAHRLNPLLNASTGAPESQRGTDPASVAADIKNADATARARGGAMPADLAPVVQQQLNSLANNVYPFQGVIWPGQQILWEIVDEDGGRESASPEDAPRQWKTRLKLILPSLGDIDATIQLDGNDIVVQMKAGETLTRKSLKGGIEGLRSRLEQAGLRLMALEVKGYESDEPAG